MLHGRGRGVIISNPIPDHNSQVRAAGRKSLHVKKDLTTIHWIVVSPLVLAF
jgi:hypothetical protein